jgi:hypothetical protein
MRVSRQTDLLRRCADGSRIGDVFSNFSNQSAFPEKEEEAWSDTHEQKE